MKKIPFNINSSERKEVIENEHKRIRKNMNEIFNTSSDPCVRSISI